MNKLLFLFLTTFVLVGCSSNAAKDYYSAVEKTARANADAHNAKMNALAIMAQNADPSAQGAAVMAIALSQTPTVVPQYVESNALKWASIIVPSVSNLGGLAIQANVAKNASDNSKEIQLATQSTNQAIQLGNQQMVSGLINGNSLAAQGTTDALVTLGVAGINAVNLAGEQTVSVAETGFSTVQNIVLDNNQLITDLNGSYNDTIETFVFNPLQPLVVEPFIVEPVIVPSI